MEKNLLKKVNHKIIFDRIEAGTYLIAGALIGKKIIIRNVLPRVIKNEIKILKDWCKIPLKNNITITKSKNMKKLTSLQNHILVFQQIFKLS